MVVPLDNEGWAGRDEGEISAVEERVIETGFRCDIAGGASAIAAQTIEYPEFGPGTEGLTTPLTQENHIRHFFRCRFHTYCSAIRNHLGWFVGTLAMTASIVLNLVRKERAAPASYVLPAILVTPRDSSTRSAATESPLALAIAFCSLRALSR